MSDKEERVDQPEDHVASGVEPSVDSPPDSAAREISPAEAAALEDEAVAGLLPAEVDAFAPGDAIEGERPIAAGGSVGAPDLAWADQAARAATDAEAGAASSAGASAPKAVIRAPLGLVRRAEMSLFWERAGVGVVFLMVYVVLLLRYRPDLMLSQTTTSGGDMGAHHYPAWYMHTYLLPHFKLTGWSMQWYAGMPMFTFYLPLPFALIGLLAYVIPYTVAFKLVTVLGVFGLPVVAFAYGRLLRLPRLFAPIAAAAALGFLAMESFSIYGANILSTLAGEFGFSISFALTFLFLGTLYRGMSRVTYDWLFVVNGLLLMCVVLSHIVTVIVLVLVAPSLLVLQRRWRALIYVAAVFGLGFLLTAFWGLPFIDKLPWSAAMAWDQLRQLKDILPADLRPAAVIAVLGVGYAFSKRDLRMFPLLWMTVLMTVLFYTLPDGRLWNGRVLPFFYFSVWLWAAYGAAWLVRPVIVMAKDLVALPPRVTLRVFAPVLAFVIAVTCMVGPRVAGSWIKWNYAGYEAKEPWPHYKAINDYLQSLPIGRVMWEHNPALDKFGTPRIFELIPYWTDQPTMEGTLMESAFTAPYHFINQAELSQQPSKAIIGVDYPADKNIKDGLTHLQFMNIPYMLSSSPEVTAALKADKRADLLKTVDIVNIFRIAGAQGYVSVMKNEPLRVKTDNWRSTIVPWYRDVNNLDVPVVWDRGEPELDQFQEITPAEAAHPPATPIETTGDVVAESVKIENESISFDTTAIGVPTWVKVSYFPNWHVKGADGPFVVSPSFMMVIPRQKHVTLYYGRTFSNSIGQFFTFIGWVVIAFILGREVVRWRRRRNVRIAQEYIAP